MFFPRWLENSPFPLFSKQNTNSFRGRNAVPESAAGYLKPCEWEEGAA